MSETNSTNIVNGKELLISLFHSSTVDYNKIFPILKDSSNIPNLLLYLKNKKNNIIDRAEIIFILFQLFNKNTLLIPLFMKKNITQIINFYEPLIDIYFSTDEYIKEYKELVEKLIIMIRNSITLTKGPIEYVYQKMSHYFENKEVEERLNENQILKYLKLLQIFYLGKFPNEKSILEKKLLSIENNENNVNTKEIKNYIYFNGLRSSISLGLNQNSVNPNKDYPTLQYGLSFIMWIYLDENLLKQYQQINKNEIKLVVINISGEQIKLVLKDLNTFQLSLNDSEYNTIQTTVIKSNDWNNLCFSIMEKSSTKLNIKLYINSLAHSSFLTVPKNFPVSNKINTIKLFENFLGKVSSFMIITKIIDQKEANYFSNTQKYGFYKNKILFDFFLLNDKNYFSNCKNYKYYEKGKTNNTMSFFDIRSSKQNIKNLIGIFCPFAYNKKENQIDDICGNFIGVLGENDGANFFINNTKEIKQLGGLNNLLPVLELMYSTISGSKKIKYNLVDKSILTQSTFYEYLNLIKNIIVDHSQNLLEANISKFFSSLSLFIEKFPSHLFTPKILKILVEIGKEAFSNVDKYTLTKENYINLILLNEKIISKYNTENQIILWSNIYSFFTSDDTQIKNFFNIRKICLLLRLFDEKRYFEYCCKYHANIFNDSNEYETENSIPIMEPEMNVRLNELFKIIQIYIDKLYDEEQTMNLFQLLSLDLSPCLQKKIIQVYINFFGNEKIELSKKIKTFEILSKHYFIELIEYVLSISLLDTRIQILSLFKILLDIKELKQKFQDYKGIEDNGMNNFYIFISDNLLPDQLLAEVNVKTSEEQNNDLDYLLMKNLGKKIKTELVLLSNYFNKTLYEKEINNLWNLLIKWVLYRIPTPKSLASKKKDKELNNIHNFIIEFCISFTTKSPFNYIDLFLLTLISYFKDESIANREKILYLNKNLYPWLIETIFYFHNSEINHFLYKKEDILSIQKNSIDLFEEFFVHRRSDDEINKRIYYILKYSIHLKKISGDTNNKKILEITRITRLLFQKILEVSSLQMNYKTKACFDFIIFHKNFSKLTGIKKHVTNVNLNRMSMKNFLRHSVTLDSNTKSINNSEKKTSNDINNNYILETVEEEEIKEKSNDDFNNKKNLNSIVSSLNFDESNSINTENKTNNSLLNKSDIIPSFIFEGLHYEYKGIKSKENETEIKGKTLKVLWEDFILYDSIIDYYSANIWGTENLRKKVKIDIDSNIISLCKNLIKEYGDNKSHKNILIKDVLKCFNIKYSEEATKAEKVKINILNINIILLSIAIEITQDFDERVFLEGKFQQFIIFCVLASININPNGIYYDLIQENLYDALGFAFIFLKKIDKKQYDKFIENLILPILDPEGGKKFSLFKNKKSNAKNSAIYRLFEIREKRMEEPEELDDIFKGPQYGNEYELTRNTVNINYKNYDKDNINNNNIHKQYKDDSNLKSKKSNNLRVAFKGEKDLILKHLFDDTLTRIKEEKKYHFSFKLNYKEGYNNNLNYGGTSSTEEKIKINKIIKKVIPLYEALVKNYANDEFLSEKKKKNIYKSTKSKLFSWKGFWSNKYLFYQHPEFLKLKIKNHFTKEMIKPLLSPVLDIDYYTPPFKKFDKSKLFNNDNYIYKINLDIDDILLYKDEQQITQVDELNNINENTINESKNKIEDIKLIQNKFGFNFLECVYKLCYNDIWEKYRLLSKQKINFDKIISLNKEPYSTLINSKKMSKNIENIQRENIYNCCIVKLTHHIQGYISTEKSRIRFIYDSNIKESELENDINYDKEMHCCFGSIFKHQKNDKDKVVISIEYINIKYIFIRQYFYIESALEIYTDSNKSYFFNFKNNKDLVQFKSDILHHGTYREIKTEDFKGKKILGYQQINPNSKKKIYLVNNKMEEWQNNYISTLEYLMWMNIYSGRSFNDLTQYPIFPWIITNFSDESQEISIKNDLRNFNLPVGMFGISEKGELRKENYIDSYQLIKTDLGQMFPDFNYQEYLKKGEEYLENYKTKRLKRQEEMIEFNQIPYFYGSHYSNPTYVSHFLTRTFPYTFISIEIQGQTFDDPDRIFTSMQKTFESACTLKDDVRELIPEFYILPEMFLNRNNLNLSQGRKDADNNLVIINNIKLPNWSNNNAINFVIKLRRYLESNIVNSNLNKWIDLIFGSTQRGEKAEENSNIFQSHTYEKIVKIESIKDIDSRNALMRLYEMGVTPFQIFDSDTKNKIRNSQNIILDEAKSYVLKVINSGIFDALKAKNYENHKYSNDPMYKEENVNISFLKIVKMSFFENEKLKIFTNKNQIYIVKIDFNEINNNSESLKIEESKAYKFNNTSTKYSCSYLLSDIETPFIVFNDNNNIIKGGFWDGRLEINITNIENKEDQNKNVFNPDFSPITTMEIDKAEKYLYCGTKNGTLLIYKLNENNIEHKKSLYLFDDEILSISINETLNMFAVSSIDGFINIYILPSYKLVRTICLNINKTNNEEILYADKIFLSNSPLPCVTIYTNSKKLFKSFSINGEFISETIETDDSFKVKSPIIYTNNYSQDILLYGTNNGFIKLRKFPEMTLINSIEVFPKEEINTICLSPDKRYCFTWSSGNVIAVIKGQEIEK